MSLLKKAAIAGVVGLVGYKLLAPKKPLTSLKGKTALVTGAAGGLGRAICLELASMQEITAIVLWDILMEEMKETENLIKALHPKCKVLCQKVNLASRSDIYSAADATKSFLGGDSPFLVVNNAGIVSGNQGCLDIDDNRIELELKINALAHVFVAKAFIPRMISSKKGGQFMNVASLAAYMSAGDLATYSMSKKAAKGFAEGLSAEMKLKGYGDLIKVGVLCPGHIKTALFDGFDGAGWSMTPEFVAEKLVQSVQQQRGITVLPPMFSPIVIQIAIAEFLGYINLPFVGNDFSPMKAWKNQQADKLFTTISDK